MSSTVRRTGNVGMCIGCIVKSIDYQILSMSSYLLIVLLMHYRYERNVRVHNCTEKVRTSSRTYTTKQTIEPTLAQELPTIDLNEDNDMNFPSVRNECSPHQAVGQDIVIDDIDVGTNNHDEIQTDEHPAINHIRRIPTVKVESNSAEANLVNTANRSNETSVVDFEDRIEPEEMNTEVGNNSAQEMWVGREFLDRHVSNYSCQVCNLCQLHSQTPEDQLN